MRSKSHLCCVSQCSVYKDNTNQLHHAPKDLQLREKWEIALKSEKPLTDNSRICSNHFKVEDYLKTGATQRKRLKRNVIPSMNLPKRSHDSVLQHPKEVGIAEPGRRAESLRLWNSRSQCTPREELVAPTRRGCRNELGVGRRGPIGVNTSLCEVEEVDHPSVGHCLQNARDDAPLESPGVCKLSLDRVERQWLNAGESRSDRPRGSPASLPEHIKYVNGAQAFVGHHLKMSQLKDNFGKEEGSLLLPVKPHAVMIQLERSMREKVPCFGPNCTPSQSCAILCHCEAFPLHHCVHCCSVGGLSMSNAAVLKSHFHLLLHEVQALHRQIGVLSALTVRYKNKWLHERRARLRTMVISKACVKLFTD